jgi:CBS domain-containing protein
MQLMQIMTHEVEVIHPDAPLAAASQKMNESDASALPVCDGQQLVGILTQHDLIRRASVQARAPETALVREVMTADLLSCFEDQQDSEVLRLMQERQIHHPAVLSRDQRLVGLISLRGVAKPQHEEALAGSAIRWPA